MDRDRAIIAAGAVEAQTWRTASLPKGLPARSILCQSIVAIVPLAEG